MHAPTLAGLALALALALAAVGLCGCMAVRHADPTVAALAVKITTRPAVASIAIPIGVPAHDALPTSSLSRPLAVAAPVIWFDAQLRPQRIDVVAGTNLLPAELPPAPTAVAPSVQRLMLAVSAPWPSVLVHRVPTVMATGQPLSALDGGLPAAIVLEVAMAAADGQALGIAVRDAAWTARSWQAELVGGRAPMPPPTTCVPLTYWLKFADAVVAQAGVPAHVVVDPTTSLADLLRVLDALLVDGVNDVYVSAVAERRPGYAGLGDISSGPWASTDSSWRRPRLARAGPRPRVTAIAGAGAAAARSLEQRLGRAPIDDCFAATPLDAGLMVHATFTITRDGVVTAVSTDAPTATVSRCVTKHVQDVRVPDNGDGLATTVTVAYRAR